MLVAHAAGQLDRARRITIEAHLGFCRPCRAAFAGWSMPGEAVLSAAGEETSPPSGPAEGSASVFDTGASWARLESGIDALEVEDDTPLFATPPPLPPGLRGLLPGHLYRRRWRRVPFSSARFTVVEHDQEAATTLLMVHIAPDRLFPRHEHLGYEDVVVLEGAFRDQHGFFRQGDYQLNDPGTIHRPEVQPGAPCWILSRYDKGVRFTGLRGLLQRLSR
jgi:putative transcriptional regulator